MKDIKVWEENWRKLVQIKIDKDFKNMNQVIGYLLKRRSDKDAKKIKAVEA